MLAAGQHIGRVICGQYSVLPPGQYVSNIALWFHNIGPGLLNNNRHSDKFTEIVCGHARFQDLLVPSEAIEQALAPVELLFLCFRSLVFFGGWSVGLGGVSRVHSGRLLGCLLPFPVGLPLPPFVRPCRCNTQFTVFV